VRSKLAYLITPLWRLLHDRRIMTLYEIFAIALAIFRFVLAGAAIVLCVMLFRRAHRIGWLLLAAMFVEPFCSLAVRAAHGRHLLVYRTWGPDTGDGTAHMILHYNISAEYICAVVGLYLLARGVRREQ
jgi:hypothetical protein